MSAPSPHSLLQRQLRRATGPDGALDAATLIALVDAAYHDHDRATRLADRAANLASEELSALAQTLREERDVSMQARRDAEAANVAKSRFLANMSHELRTPLNAVIGYTELIAEEAQELRNDAIAADCKRVLSAAQHLLSLIQDVLDISKIEAGKLTLRPEVGDLDQMFHDLQSTALPLAAKNANMLVFECDGSLGRAFLDIVKLRQCALNLLSNACKFTRNGAITARFRRDLSISGDVLRIEVTDTGMGISEEKRRQLFEPFVQAHELTIEGAGLGLAITRRLCELMGGAVSVTSVLGEGSTFTITLPIPAIEACAAA